MLSSSLDALFQSSKKTSHQKLFDYDCITMYMNVTRCTKQNMFYNADKGALRNLNIDEIQHFAELRNVMECRASTWRIKFHINKDESSIGVVSVCKRTKKNIQTIFYFISISVKCTGCEGCWCGFLKL